MFIKSILYNCIQLGKWESDISLYQVLLKSTKKKKEYKFKKIPIAYSNSTVEFKFSAEFK